MLCPDDFFCRAAVYPRVLNHSLYSDDAFLQFSGKGASTRSLSLASRFLCRSEDGVHDFGERVAQAGNDRLLEKHGTVPEADRNLYLGYYEFRYCRFAPLRVDYCIVRLYWKPDSSRDERHFQVDLYPLTQQVEAHVQAGIALEMETAHKAGKKQPQINAANRAERVVDASVRALRGQIASILRGPLTLLVDAGDPRAPLQALLPMKVEPQAA